MSWVFSHLQRVGTPEPFFA